MSPAPAKLVLAGYAGFGNAGDEWIARSVRRALPAAEWTTLGTDASRLNPLTLLPLLRRSKALVYGGGELFQTRTSFRSLLYYAGLPCLARAVGVPFLAFGMGVDPGLSRAALAITVAALNRADRIWFRDQDSLALYRNAGGRVPCDAAPDPVWSQEGEIPPPPPALRRVLWIPRRPLRFERLLSLAGKTGPAPGFLFLHPARDAGDFPSLPGLESWNTLDDLPAIAGGYDAVVSMRYHGLVLAALAGRPAVAMAAHPKVAALGESLGCPVVPPTVSAARLEEALAESFRRASEQRDKARLFRDQSRRGLEQLRRHVEAL